MESFESPCPYVSRQRIPSKVMDLNEIGRFDNCRIDCVPYLLEKENLNKSPLHSSNTTLYFPLSNLLNISWTVLADRLRVIW